MKYLLFIFLLFSFKSKAQNKVPDSSKNKIFITAGYGLAGGIFVIGYAEQPPFASGQYRAFYNKNFIGSAQNLSIGFKINQFYEIKTGINYQHFTRRIKSIDTLQTVVINLDNTIHSRDYMFFASLDRKLERKKHMVAAGLGVYYLMYQAQFIEYGVGIPNFYVDRESRFDDGYNAEGGVLVEISYEYKFQPRVSLGIRGQFYYTMSVWSSESVTLFPFIKIGIH